MKQGFQLREVFNIKEVNLLGENIQKNWPKFDKTEFSKSIGSQLDKLNFGDRNKLIRDRLKDFLPDDFPQAVKILIKSLGPELGEPELTGFEGFIIMPQCGYVSKYGLDHFDISITALFEMTKRFSAEGDMRAFIQKYPEKTLKILEKWTSHDNCHVRRLVSECTRPRLPLCYSLRQFINDPYPVIKLLHKLKEDPELYVRRSVANNLNDISKDNPDSVVKTLKKWDKIKNKGTRWIIRHALRSLIKQGNKDALNLLGYSSDLKIKIKKIELSSDMVKIGDNLIFEFQIESKEKEVQNLMIDYIIHHKKANGNLKPKVFKLTKKTIGPHEIFTVSKTHSFKIIGTRKYYPGDHLIEIQINGKFSGKRKFKLN